MFMIVPTPKLNSRRDTLPHGNRIMDTFANDIAAEQYLKYQEEGFTMPVGSVLAKESITISIKKNGPSQPTFDDDQNGNRINPQNK